MPGLRARRRAGVLLRPSAAPRERSGCPALYAQPHYEVRPVGQAWQAWLVGSDVTLRVGPVCISTFPRGIHDDFLAVFHDDMMDAWEDPVDEYFRPISDGPDEPEPGRLVVALDFTAPGPVIAERLDLMGFTAESARVILDKELAEKPPRIGDSGCQPWTSQDWIDALASSTDDPEAVFWQEGTRPWLIDVLEELDACAALRVALLAFP